MFLMKAAYCRVFQGAFRLVLPVLPYREPELVASCKDLGPVMEKEGIHAPSSSPTRESWPMGFWRR